MNYRCNFIRCYQKCFSIIGVYFNNMYTKKIYYMSIQIIKIKLQLWLKNSPTTPIKLPGLFYLVFGRDKENKGTKNS